jgi:hypothetical protein
VTLMLLTNEDLFEKLFEVNINIVIMSPYMVNLLRFI